MSTASTTVAKTRKRPVNVVAFGTDGTTPSTSNLAFSSSNSTIVLPSVDPNNNRRFLLEGKNQGQATVEIGSGNGKLVITVDVGPAPDLSHVELNTSVGNGGFEDEV